MNNDIDMPWHVARLKESGQNISSYCQQNGIAYHSMQYWIKKLGRKSNPGLLSEKKEMFIELSQKENTHINPYLSEPSSQNPQVEITFPSGLCLRIFG